MIRRTIREHLDKEKRLRPQGIKVLSLFFIDAVDKYRQYDADGKPVKGDYARIFEEEYRRAGEATRTISTLFKEVDLLRAAEEVHNGYFSIDRKGTVDRNGVEWKETRGNRDNAETGLQPDNEGEGEAACLRDAAKIHLLAFGAARGMGQPQRLPNLHVARHPDGARAAADNRARLAHLR